MWFWQTEGWVRSVWFWVSDQVHLVWEVIPFENNFYRLLFTPPSGRLIGPSQAPVFHSRPHRNSLQHHLASENWKTRKRGHYIATHSRSSLLQTKKQRPLFSQRTWERGLPACLVVHQGDISSLPLISRCARFLGTCSSSHLPPEFTRKLKSSFFSDPASLPIF
jgi:hypothetical protein